MVSKLTLLEPHFDGAQFGPKTIDGEAFNDEETTREKSLDGTEESQARSRKTMVIQGLIGFIFLAVVIYSSLRLATSDDE